MLNINVANINKVFRDFYTLTNIRIVLYNKEKEMILEYPAEKNTFCNIIEKDESWSKKCENCDRANIEKCSETEELLYYRCHLGLTEAMVPIRDVNGILGYVMFGQVLADDTSEKTKNRLKDLFGYLNDENIIDAIEKIPVKTSAELDACVTVLQAMASYIFTNQWVTPQCSEFIRRMDKLIEKNLDKNITVEDICAEFHMKRTRLYSISKEYLGCSVASYIRKQRIHHACRMLRETDISVSRIAEKTGFLDYGHFSRIFRQLQGISATSYRKQYQTKSK